MGISQLGLDTLMDENNDSRLCIFDQAMSVVHSSLREGKSLDSFTSAFVQRLSASSCEMEIMLRRQGSLRTGLLDWTYDLVGRSSATAMMGPSFLQKDPQALLRNRQFEDDFHYFAVGIPRFLIGRAWGNRRQLHDLFMMSHPERATWVDQIERLSRSAGLGDHHDISTAIFGFWHA
jgi:hypothetical protein